MPINNSLPYEIIAAPFTVYFAPVGTAFSLIDAVPATPWTKVGSSGDLNYFDEGVRVAPSQETEPFRAAGDMGTRKMFRISEDLAISLKLADLTLEQLAHAFNGNAVTTTAAGAGTAGFKSIGLSRGSSIYTVALMVRGPSPYMEDGNMQFQIPRAAQVGNPEVIFRKGEPAGLALEWMALVDPNAANEFERFGKLIAQNAVAL